jgi:hypothetical protein
VGDRIVVDPAALAELSRALRAVHDVLDDLARLDLDADDLGDARVTDAAREVRDGWYLARARVHQQVSTLAAYTDAVARAARDADATIVTGRGR